MRIANVILAAGFGTRMKSELPKVMHPLMGRPMVEWAVRMAEAISQEPPVLVVGHGRELVEQHLGRRARYAIQRELLGTGHAVQQAAPLLQGQADAVLVSYADMPLLRAETLQALIASFEAARAAGQAPALAMLTVVRDDPQGFGRIVRDAQGAIQAIVEEVDCTPEQRQIKELNPGIYCFDAEWLWANLDRIPLSAKGEYYLTDMVGIAVAQGRTVVTKVAPTEEVDGINNRLQLAQATAVLRRRILEAHMLNGVTILDPASTYIEDTVEIGADSVIWPGVFLQGETRIGRHSQIGPHSQVIASQIGNHCRISYSVVEQARMDDHSEIGPFGHLRKGAHLGEGVHMGNFGEVKNSYLGPGVKMGHFSYIGDAQIGANSNIGAGTITCNFDGEKKHKTVIGEDVFIGSDTMLVAPLEIGPGARTGAGSVVTRDVPAHTLVYGVPARPSPMTKPEPTPATSQTGENGERASS
ncbi:MAG TPA: bifunctional UDP-N-acetylglucosamine diphosphorylase/glucosamine-1-phosphate N-acetyltransferase GlmU [Caldilineaceae bacterium]|nr:bifunctional UDP-N-acetylglucosamine diphosphorylase/glucosamine-1-phosphate N-acetyltransferase GlmU [Caldilineaceae bacterium]